jgi:DNA-binding transcriptional MerR regulator
MMEQRRLRIGQVAKEIGVSDQTIRNLEKRGLISPQRDWDGNRIFGPGDVEKIASILFPQGSQK